jgi:hypothetical protein
MPKRYEAVAAPFLASRPSARVAVVAVREDSESLRSEPIQCWTFSSGAVTALIR